MNKSRMKKIGMYLLLTIGAIAMILPFLWMLSTSLKSSNVTFVLPPKWIPDNPNLESYRQVFETVPMGRFFFNSIFVAVISTFFQVLICSMAGYAFARIQFKGREVLFYVYLATLMVPQQVTLTPLFIMMNMLGWANTYQALILPGIFSAFGTFLMRQFFMGIPNELYDAALIDGSGHLRFLIQIVLPLSKAALVTVVLLSFIGSWNSFLWPLIVARDVALYPIQVGLRSFITEMGNEVHLMMAAATFVIVPVLVLYFFTQKQFTEGIATTGLKG